MSLPQNVTPEIRFSKPYSRYHLFFKHILNSVRFFINVERDEFGLKRRKGFSFRESRIYAFKVYYMR